MHYFKPSLSYHLSFISLFCLFLSGRFTLVLLYVWQTTGERKFKIEVSGVDLVRTFIIKCTESFQTKMFIRGLNVLIPL